MKANLSCFLKVKESQYVCRKSIPGLESRVKMAVSHGSEEDKGHGEVDSRGRTK